MIRIFITLLFLMTVFPHVLSAQDIPQECRLLSAHKPSKGVAFEPGIDVHGKPVVGADINTANFDMPDVTTVPLSVDLIGRIRENPEQFKGVEALADYGLLEIYKDGRVLFNGNDWSQPFYVLCGQKAPDAIKQEPPVGQPKSDIDVPPPPPSVEHNKEIFLEGGEYREESYR